MVGCVAGAVLVSETKDMMKAAGFADILFDAKRDYIDSMSQWNDPLYRGIIEKLPSSEKLSNFITSLYVSARKPNKLV